MPPETRIHEEQDVDPAQTMLAAYKSDPLRPLILQQAHQVRIREWLRQWQREPHDAGEWAEGPALDQGYRSKIPDQLTPCARVMNLHVWLEPFTGERRFSPTGRVTLRPRNFPRRAPLA